jgi:hypothetical protein
MIVDQAASKAGLDLRRYAMKPTPAKPRIIIAHVESSGTDDTAKIEVFEIVGGATAEIAVEEGKLKKIPFPPFKNTSKTVPPPVEVPFCWKKKFNNESCPAALVPKDPEENNKLPVKDAEYEPIVIVADFTSSAVQVCESKLVPPLSANTSNVTSFPTFVPVMEVAETMPL